MDWESWCRRNRFPAGLLRPVGPAWLPDRALDFTIRSGTRRGGVLDVRPRKGAAAPGYLFEVAQGGWEALDRKEGAPHFYRRLDTVALLDGGEEVAVTTYEVCPERRVDFVAPHPDYVAVVQAGFEAHGLDTYALERAAAATSRACDVNALFVYGTLMRGESRGSLIADARPRCALLAETPGRLVDLGEYPGLLAPGREAGWVRGEFCRFDSAGDLLDLLDGVEGFEGFGRPDSLYRRTLVGVGVGDGRARRAWTYVYNGAAVGAAPIVTGDWREHRGRRGQFLEALAAAHCGGDEPRVAAALARMDLFLDDEAAGAEARRLLPLADALARGLVSERRLAQATGRWSVIPA